MGKALVTEPTVAAAEDADNEFGRCKVCQANCFRGSTQDLCQVCLRCNVDYQYQTRIFPNEETTGHDVPDGASEHAAKKPQQGLPVILGWLLRPGSIAIKTRLLSIAIAARSSTVADHYATKYLAKPQQWLAFALGALIAGFRKNEQEQKEAGEMKILAQPIFACDAHYKLAPGFMQAVRPSHRRCLARFNVPNCY